jgi:hypothetical protein
VYGLPNLQTNRPQFQHHPAVDVHCALYPLRLRVVESNNVTGSKVTGCDVLYRHVPTARRLPNDLLTSDSPRFAQRDR